VANAERILLFVHGIIGDTQSMVPSVQLARLADARPLARLYNLTAIAWPASVVGGLAAWLENPTVAFNEMLSTSKVLEALKRSPDPGIPYVMLAGNTSIIPAAAESSKGGKGSLLGRLLKRLSSPELLHRVANPFFLDQENDVAVSVAIMENTPSGWKPQFEVRPVACDHLSYSRNPEGLKALATILAEAVRRPENRWMEAGISTRRR